MDLLTFNHLHKKYLRETENMTNMRKVTTEEKQAIADLLGVDIDKIPGEVDWEDNEDEEDEDETETELAEEDEEDEDGSDDEEEEVEDGDDEEDDELEDDDDEDDEDSDAEEDMKVREAMAEWEQTDKSIPFLDYCKQKIKT